jgi:hypothetical protein
MQPNFFVVGAPKAGTTALYHFLDQHPGVYMSPIKEPAHFATDLLERQRLLGVVQAEPQALRAWLDGPMTGKRSGVIEEWTQYLKLFKHVREETAVGEVSGNYLASRAAPGAIRARIPHARIVMMLRDPVERLYSQFAQAASRGQARPQFLPWVEEQQAHEATYSPRLGAVWNGFYAQHLARWLQHFPRPQIQVLFYDDYRADPRAVLRGLYGFLGVVADFEADVRQRHNVALRPRFPALQRASQPLRQALRPWLPARWRQGWRELGYRPWPPITAAERAAALPIYAEDVAALQALVQRDLSAWLRI